MKPVNRIVVRRTLDRFSLLRIADATAEVSRHKLLSRYPMLSYSAADNREPNRRR
ncbi:MAG: hypothetical protein ACJ8KA_06930 [Sulfurifustis sp.]